MELYFVWIASQSVTALGCFGRAAPCGRERPAGKEVVSFRIFPGEDRPLGWRTTVPDMTSECRIFLIRLRHCTIIVNPLYMQLQLQATTHPPHMKCCLFVFVGKCLNKRSRMNKCSHDLPFPNKTNFCSIFSNKPDFLDPISQQNKWFVRV